MLLESVASCSTFFFVILYFHFNLNINSKTKCTGTRRVADYSAIARFVSLLLSILIGKCRSFQLEQTSGKISVNLSILVGSIGIALLPQHHLNLIIYTQLYNVVAHSPNYKKNISRKKSSDNGLFLLNIFLLYKYVVGVAVVGFASFHR